MDCTYYQWKRAQELAKKAEQEGEAHPQEVLDVVLSSPEPGVSTTWEDIKNAPHGTVVDDDGEVFVSYYGVWRTPGSELVFTDEDFFNDSPVTIVRWGDGE